MTKPTKGGAVAPLRDLVLCQVLDHETKQTPAGIVLPDNARGRPKEAKVLAVGDGPITAKGVQVAPSVAPGDVVIFDPYAIALVLADGAMANAGGSPLADHGQRFLIQDRHLLAVVSTDG
jgi:chaperonin GroES